jgi:hypothetical protein
MLSVLAISDAPMSPVAHMMASIEAARPTFLNAVSGSGDDQANGLSSRSEATIIYAGFARITAFSILVV